MFNLSRKRVRDESDDELEITPTVKRPCSLPFRTSPTIKHTRLFSHSPRRRPSTLFTQPLTPADSEEETSPASSTTHQPHLPTFSQTNMNTGFHANYYDSDMDMVESAHVNSSPRPWEYDTAMMSPKTSPCTVLPPSIGGSTPVRVSTETARLPTPIYGHFQQSIETSTEVAEPSTNEELQTPQEANHDLYMRRRRLPTPISEDEAMDNFAISPRTDDIPADAASHGLRKPARFPPPLASQPPAKRGKIMFSMGFRADCEMCRNRVPGHCNHIFRA